MNKKEILLKSIIGFPIGVTLLLISYVGIYFVAGQDVFQNEINQLKDINVLINQIIMSGISWYAIFVGFKFTYVEEDKYLKIKDVIINIIIVFASMITFGILNETARFSQNVSDMNIIILVIGLVIIGLTIIIKSSIDKYLINKKIKEINK